ncbi:MAG: hypothetical protein EXR51_06915 [Dehalococcoidia bacterium]|nr:hypothetical protein [Dehalococcoidia bacterium]
MLAPNFGSIEGNYVMLPAMTYFWRIRTTTSTKTGSALADSDWSPWSTRTFRTAAVSSNTISPVTTSVSSLNPTLVWNNSDRLVFYYEVQVSKDATFRNEPGAAFLYWELRHGAVSNPPNSSPSRMPSRWRAAPATSGGCGRASRATGTPLAWSSTYSFTSP